MRGVVGRHSVYIKCIILAHVSIYLLSIYCVSGSKLLSMEDTTMNGTQLCLQGITVKQGTWNLTNRYNKGISAKKFWLPVIFISTFKATQLKIVSLCICYASQCFEDWIWVQSVNPELVWGTNSAQDRSPKLMSLSLASLIELSSPSGILTVRHTESVSLLVMWLALKK